MKRLIAYINSSKNLRCIKSEREALIREVAKAFRRQLEAIKSEMTDADQTQVISVGEFLEESEYCCVSCGSEYVADEGKSWSKRPNGDKMHIYKCGACGCQWEE